MLLKLLNYHRLIYNESGLQSGLCANLANVLLDVKRTLFLFSFTPLDLLLQFDQIRVFSRFDTAFAACWYQVVSYYSVDLDL